MIQIPTSTASPKVAMCTNPRVHTFGLRTASVSGAATGDGRMRVASTSHATVDSAISPDETTNAGRQPSRLARSGIR